ncbi:hypothetical protein CC78DRAFT_573687 [Lojkania enalia]|uniref:Uncharacterized protein n=1 Tax=Lojkania enalia TaxID=147567 RepID=A0A9P4NBY1_9PLEO|nr:hypothetical protein CC78DRAFT_573687 [Didymosphaeria enalia]
MACRPNCMGPFLLYLFQGGAKALRPSPRPRPSPVHRVRVSRARPASTAFPWPGRPAGEPQMDQRARAKGGDMPTAALGPLRRPASRIGPGHAPSNNPGKNSGAPTRTFHTRLEQTQRLHRDKIESSPRSTPRATSHFPLPTSMHCRLGNHEAALLPDPPSPDIGRSQHRLPHPLYHHYPFDSWEKGFAQYIEHPETALCKTGAVLAQSIVTREATFEDMGTTWFEISKRNGRVQGNIWKDGLAPVTQRGGVCRV